MPTRYWIYTAAILVGLAIGTVIANAQEVYRPVLVKQGELKDTGLFCLTSEEIALGFQLLGIKQTGSANAGATKFYNLDAKRTLSVEFAADGCAVSATMVVR